MPGEKPKSREVIDRVARRLVTESEKPHNRTMTHEQAREIARRTRLRKERDGR